MFDLPRTTSMSQRALKRKLSQAADVASPRRTTFLVERLGKRLPFTTSMDLSCCWNQAMSLGKENNLVIFVVPGSLVVFLGGPVVFLDFVAWKERRWHRLFTLFYIYTIWFSHTPSSILIILAPKQAKSDRLHSGAQQIEEPQGGLNSKQISGNRGKPTENLWTVSKMTQLRAADTILEAPMRAESAVDMMAARVEQVIIVTRKYWNHPPQLAIRNSCWHHP